MEWKRDNRNVGKNNIPPGLFSSEFCPHTGIEAEIKAISDNFEDISVVGGSTH